MTTEDHYIRDGDTIRGTTWDGSRTRGDLVFETVQFAMFTRDIKLLTECKRLLMIPRRWPERMDTPDGSGRNPKSITRDPYWMFWAACVEMDKREWIAHVKPPVFTPEGILWRPDFAAFRRFLLNPTKRNKRWYERMDWLSWAFSPGIPMFAIYLNAWAAWIADSERCMARIRPSVPEWNLCIRQLVLHPDRHLDEQAIKDFRPRKGFIWQKDPRREHDAEIINNPQFLPLDQEYYLDLDSLTYVYERNKEKS